MIIPLATVEKKLVAPIWGELTLPLKKQIGYQSLTVSYLHRR